jgi:predicted negative regulator of RcsB-dependent stress response
MAEQSAFDKQHIQESSHSEGGGLLEHLNLPPVFIRFVKKNKKNLQIGAVVVGVVVMSLILYSSYRSNRIQNASAALAFAMQATGPEKHKALVGVAADFSGTPAAHWANTELAHELMKEGKFKEAAEQYGKVRKNINTSDPLFALLTFGLAQANDAAGLFDAAALDYKALQKIDGYAGEGYTGLARIYEAQKKEKEALAVYEEYVATFTGQNQNDPAKIAVDEKIIRLKAMQ